MAGDVGKVSAWSCTGTLVDMCFFFLFTEIGTQMSSLIVFHFSPLH